MKQKIVQVDRYVKILFLVLLQYFGYVYNMYLKMSLIIELLRYKISLNSIEITKYFYYLTSSRSDANPASFVSQTDVFEHKLFRSTIILLCKSSRHLLHIYAYIQKVPECHYVII
jgi:hypothetical protein